MIRGHNKTCRDKWETLSGGFYCPIHKSFIDQEEDFADDQRKIWKNEGMTCLYCAHLKDIYGSKCVAFPSQIPEPYLRGMETHRKSNKYMQKNNFVFTPKEIKRPPKTKCPKCGSKKDVIPIAYGYPTAQTMKEAEKGNIKLGGCCIADVETQWYCKSCKKEFVKISMFVTL